MKYCNCATGYPDENGLCQRCGGQFALCRHGVAPKKCRSCLAGGLADRIEEHVKNAKGTNPFEGLKLTKEERELLAEAGIV